MAMLLRKKTIVIIILALLVVGGGLASALVYFSAQLKQEQATPVEVRKPVKAKTVCTDDTLTQGAAAIAYPVDTVKLEAVATSIIATADYTSDVNCLYVVLQYNLAFSQASAARTNLTSIKGLYNSAVGYSSIIAENASPPEVLEKMVANLEKTQAAFIKGDKINGLEEEPPVEGSSIDE